MNSQIGPRGKLLRFKHIKIMHGNFTFMFGYWADSVVHLPPLKSSMGRHQNKFELTKHAGMFRNVQTKLRVVQNGIVSPVVDVLKLISPLTETTRTSYF